MKCIDFYIYSAQISLAIKKKQLCNQVGFIYLVLM